MATAKDFVGRVNQIAGVAGCLLIRSDGMVVDQINDQSFYVFPIDQYLLGIVQQADCSVNEMLEQVFYLIDKVSTNRG